MAHSYNAPACCRELQWPSDVQCISAAQPAAAGNGLLVKMRALRSEPGGVTMFDELQARHDPPAAGTRTGARSMGGGEIGRCAIEQRQDAPNAGGPLLS